LLLLFDMIMREPSGLAGVLPWDFSLGEAARGGWSGFLLVYLQ